MTKPPNPADVFNHLNTLRVALIVGAYDNKDDNHKVVFVSDQFTAVFGYTINDIPDKQTWWTLAYPDKSYRKVVQRQWELLADHSLACSDRLLEMEINITAKDQTVIRTTVSAEAPNKTVPGHYIITFRTS